MLLFHPMTPKKFSFTFFH
jgi:hypothetical protein